MFHSLLRSFKHAFRGLKTTIKTEATFRLHIFIAILVILFAWQRQVDEKSWLILLLVIAFILSLEIINSAVERLVDILAPRTHAFAKEIKDLLAAMVLLASLFALVVGLIIFF